MLATIRPKNETLCLTGMLLYSGGNIIQTLDGPDEAVDTTFASIVRDPRHRGVFTLLRERIDERAFPDWTMGSATPATKRSARSTASRRSSSSRPDVTSETQPARRTSCCGSSRRTCGDGGITPAGEGSRPRPSARKCK
jgi:hypothetical protein